MKQRLLSRSRPTFGLLVKAAIAAPFALVVTLASSSASAYDALAAPCKVDPGTCEIAKIAFSHKDALPIEFDFDTGWVPANSPLQVHIWAGVFANTHVSLTGALETSWPNALVLKTPGDPGGGNVGFHYGVDVGAQGKIEVDVAGQKYSWTGDIPYFPQFDFQVEADQPFDAWGFPPGMSVSGKTQQQTLAEVSIADLVGASIPGIDGGFALDVAMELQATYATTQIVLESTDGKPVAGGPITSDKDVSSMDYKSGPSVEVDVHPEGRVSYDGVLHLIPEFYVDLLGQHWDIPIADIPISFPITKTDWVFDTQRVHVPLPDLVVSTKEIDFGDVEVGQKNLETYNLWNAGEAAAIVSIISSDPDAFEVFDFSADLGATETKDSAVRFAPKANGEFQATIYVGSNDPSDPVQEILVKGRGYGGPEAAPSAASVTEQAGCACTAAGGEDGDQGGGEAGAVLFALGAAAITRRRRGARR